MSEELYYLIAPAGPLELPKEKHFFFGRAEGNNIVVDDIRASRRHAELYFDGAHFVLMDLDSSNGTSVNNQRITSKVLENGDEIQIGFQSYRFRVVDDRAELEQSVLNVRKDTRHMVTAEMPNPAQMLPDTDFNGSLSTMPATEICQLMALGRRSGMLLTMDEKKRKGILYFRDGEIIGAELGLIEGEDAVFEILRFRAGSFSFRTRHPIPKENVKAKTAHLLLEAARRGDETDK